MRCRGEVFCPYERTVALYPDKEATSLFAPVAGEGKNWRRSERGGSVFSTTAGDKKAGHASLAVGGAREMAGMSQHWWQKTIHMPRVRVMLAAAAARLARGAIWRNRIGFRPENRFQHVYSAQCTTIGESHIARSRDMRIFVARTSRCRRKANCIVRYNAFLIAAL